MIPVLTSKNKLLKVEQSASKWLACRCRILGQQWALHAAASPAPCCAVHQPCAWTSHQPSVFPAPVLARRDQLLRAEQCASRWLHHPQCVALCANLALRPVTRRRRFLHCADQEGPAADFWAVRKHMAGMRLQDTGSGVGSALCYITFLVLRCAPALRMDHDES